MPGRTTTLKVERPRILVEGFDMNKREVLETLITKIDDEQEPLFLLRGRDPLASIAIIRWIHEAEDNGVKQSKRDDAMKVALAMMSYLPKRLPD